MSSVALNFLARVARTALGAGTIAGVTLATIPFMEREFTHAANMHYQLQERLHAQNQNANQQNSSPGAASTSTSASGSTPNTTESSMPGNLPRTDRKDRDMIEWVWRF